MNVVQQQMNNAVLSVNCALVAGVQRVLGPAFLWVLVEDLHRLFQESHQRMHEDESRLVVKNILNILLHLFIFESLTSTLLVEVIQKALLEKFSEGDLEVLLFVLHNIGLQLRKSDPASVKEIIRVFEVKKNSFEAEAKMGGEAKKAQKIKFLAWELADIKNNKGTTTLQIKSIEHLHTWLKKNKHL